MTNPDEDARRFDWAPAWIIQLPTLSLLDDRWDDLAPIEETTIYTQVEPFIDRLD